MYPLPLPQTWQTSDVSLPLSPHSTPQPHKAAAAQADRGNWPPGSLVAQLTDPERIALLAAGSPVQFPDDAILVLQGDPGDGLYVLTAGMVKVTVAAESGTETMLAIRSRGDLIGEFAVLDGMPRTATARAVGAVCAIRISRARFAEFGQQYPAAQTTITKSLVAKMRAATERHAAERTWGARERVAQVLYELAADYGEPAERRGGDSAADHPVGAGGAGRGRGVDHRAGARRAAQRGRHRDQVPQDRRPRHGLPRCHPIFLTRSR